MKKQYQTVMSVEDAMAVVCHSLKKGADFKVIANALMNDGFPQHKVDTIMRWAYRKNKAEQYAPIER